MKQQVLGFPPRSLEKSFSLDGACFKATIVIRMYPKECPLYETFVEGSLSTPRVKSSSVSFVNPRFFANFYGHLTVSSLKIIEFQSFNELGRNKWSSTNERTTLLICAVLLGTLALMTSIGFLCLLCAFIRIRKTRRTDIDICNSLSSLPSFTLLPVVHNRLNLCLLN